MSIFSRFFNKTETRNSGAEERGYMDTFMDGAFTASAGVVASQSTATRFPAVFSAIRILCDNVSTLKIMLVDKSSSNPVAVPIPSWLTQPNTYSNVVDFLSDIVSSLSFDGNAFILVVSDEFGKILELHLLDPQTVLVEKSLNLGEPTFYVHSSAGGIKLPPYSKATTMGILHIRSARRPGHIRGMSPISECGQAIATTLAASQYQSSLFANAAVPFGVIEISEKVDKEEIKDILRGWKLGRQGPNGAGLPAILAGGAAFKPLTLSPADLDILERLRFGVRDIARVFQVPAWILQDENTTSYGSSEAAMAFFTKFSLRTLAFRIQTALSKLLPDEYVMQFSFDELLKAETDVRFQAYATAIQNGIISPNEARIEEGLLPYPGGDEFLRPLNMGTPNEHGKQ